MACGCDLQHKADALPSSGPPLPPFLPSSTLTVFPVGDIQPFTMAGCTTSITSLTPASGSGRVAIALAAAKMDKGSPPGSAAHTCWSSTASHGGPRYIQKIKSGEEDFESLASQFSDCSSAKARGDLGAFSR
ncbi:hypothetical protein E2I00_009484, partial [Balaenoptera physalus]